MGAAKGMVRRQIQGVQGVSPPLVRSRCLCPLVLSGLSRGAVCVSATLSRGAWCPCPLVLSGLLQVRGHLSPPILLCLSEPISPYLTLTSLSACALLTEHVPTQHLGNSALSLHSSFALLCD